MYTRSALTSQLCPCLECAIFSHAFWGFLHRAPGLGGVSTRLFQRRLIKGEEEKAKLLYQCNIIYIAVTQRGGKDVDLLQTQRKEVNASGSEDAASGEHYMRLHPFIDNQLYSITVQNVRKATISDK